PRPRRARREVAQAEQREIDPVDAVQYFRIDLLRHEGVARAPAAGIDRGRQVAAFGVQPARQLTRDLEGIEFEPAREPAHHRDDPEVRIFRRRHVTDGFAQGRAPADTDGAWLLL